MTHPQAADRKRPQTSAGARWRVLLVDDHPIVREGLAARIEMEGDMIVSGMAETADQAIGLIQKSEPDIVVTDLSLSGRHCRCWCFPSTMRTFGPSVFFARGRRDM